MEDDPTAIAQPRPRSRYAGASVDRPVSSATPKGTGLKSKYAGATVDAGTPAPETPGIGTPSSLPKSEGSLPPQVGNFLGGVEQTTVEPFKPKNLPQTAMGVVPGLAEGVKAYREGLSPEMENRLHANLVSDYTKGISRGLAFQSKHGRTMTPDEAERAASSEMERIKSSPMDRAFEAGQISGDPQFWKMAGIGLLSSVLPGSGAFLGGAKFMGGLQALGEYEGYGEPSTQPQDLASIAGRITGAALTGGILGKGGEKVVGAIRGTPEGEAPAEGGVQLPKGTPAFQAAATEGKAIAATPTETTLQVPAIKLPDGTILKGARGESHQDIIDRLHTKPPRIEHGFIDENGKYVSRTQARKEVNAKGGKLPPGKPRSEDLTPRQARAAEVQAAREAAPATSPTVKVGGKKKAPEAVTPPTGGKEWTTAVITDHEGNPVGRRLLSPSKRADFIDKFNAEHQGKNLKVTFRPSTPQDIAEAAKARAQVAKPKTKGGVTPPVDLSKITLPPEFTGKVVQPKVAGEPPSIKRTGAPTKEQILAKLEPKTRKPRIPTSEAERKALISKAPKQVLPYVEPRTPNVTPAQQATIERLASEKPVVTPEVDLGEINSLLDKIAREEEGGVQPTPTQRPGVEPEDVEKRLPKPDLYGARDKLTGKVYAASSLRELMEGLKKKGFVRDDPEHKWIVNHDAVEPINIIKGPSGKIEVLSPEGMRGRARSALTPEELEKFGVLGGEGSARPPFVTSQPSAPPTAQAPKPETLSQPIVRGFESDAFKKAYGTGRMQGQGHGPLTPEKITALRSNLASAKYTPDEIDGYVEGWQEGAKSFKGAPATKVNPHVETVKAARATYESAGASPRILNELRDATKGFTKQTPLAQEAIAKDVAEHANLFKNKGWLPAWRDSQGRIFGGLTAPRAFEKAVAGNFGKELKPAMNGPEVQGWSQGYVDKEGKFFPHDWAADTAAKSAKSPTTQPETAKVVPEVKSEPAKLVPSTPAPEVVSAEGVTHEPRLEPTLENIVKTGQEAVNALDKIVSHFDKADERIKEFNSLREQFRQAVLAKDKPRAKFLRDEINKRAYGEMPKESGPRVIYDMQDKRAYPEGTATFNHLKRVLGNNVTLRGRYFEGTKAGNVIHLDENTYTGDKAQVVPSPEAKGMSKGAIQLPTAFQDAARILNQGKAKFDEWFDNSRFSKTGRFSANIARKFMGEYESHLVPMLNIFDGFAKALDKIPDDERIEFMDNVNKGQPVGKGWEPLAYAWKAVNKHMEDFAHTFEDKWGLPRDYILKRWKDNYWPTRFKRKSSPDVIDRRIPSGRRRFLGTQNWRKARGYGSIKESLAANPDFELISTNPVDHIMNTYQDFLKMITREDTLRSLQDAGLRKFVKDADVEEMRRMGWIQEPTEKGEVTFRTKQGVRGKSGQYMVPQPTYKILDSMTSNGLWDKSWYKGLKSFSNRVNGINLGLNGFHYEFTAMQAGISDMARGMVLASQGKPLKGAAVFMEGLAPAVSAGKYAVEGWKIRKTMKNLPISEWGKKSYDIKAFNIKDVDPIDAMIDSGWKWTRDREFTNEVSRALSTAIRNAIDKPSPGTAVPAAWRVAMAPYDYFSKALFDHWVPALKTGLAHRMMSDFLENAPPGLSYTDYLEAVNKIHDSVENRLGEVNYDRLLMNKKLQNALTLAIRAPAWKGGSFREFGGGIWDLKDLYKDLKSGKGMSTRTAYSISTLIHAAVYGALLNYMGVGKWPEEAKDFWTTWRNYSKPLSGKILPDGTPERLQFPFEYTKELEEFSRGVDAMAHGNTGPMGEYITSGMGPVPRVLSDLWHNQNYNREKIYGEGGKGMLSYLNETIGPASTIGLSAQRRKAEQESAGLTEPGSISGFETWLGVTLPKQRWMATPFQNKLREGMSETNVRGRYTQDQIAAMKVRRTLTAMARRNDPQFEEAVAKYYTNGTLSKEQIRQIVRDATEAPIAKDLERSSMLNILKNLQYANPKEKADATIAIIRKLKGDKKNVYMQSAEYARWRPYFLSLHIENSDLLEEGDTGVTSDTGERIKVPVPKSDYLP